MIELLRLAAAVVAMATAQTSAHADEKRVALVIGNSAYQNTTPLRNPENDAADVASELAKLGFRVILGLNLDKAAMDAKIAAFAEALGGADMGLFFYGGHGLQVGGQNYLVPVDSRLSSASALDFETVPLELVQRAMERDARTNILFLDACRDNPLTRSLARALGTRSVAVSRGLAAVESGIGTLISFSTQPGNVALDGEGRNSPFAAALVKHLADDDSVMDILISVRNAVVAETRQRQVPWEHSALRSRVYFKQPPKALRPMRLATTDPAAFEQQAELELWSAVGTGNSPELLEAFLHQFPNGTFAATARIMIELHKKKRAAEDRAQQPEPQPVQESAASLVTASRVETTAAEEVDGAGLGRPPRPAVTRADDAKDAGAKKAERPARRRERTRLSSASGGRSKGRACTPINGPYGYYNDPWCRK